MMTSAMSLSAFLLLLLLLLLSIVPTITEVVTSISICNHFLLGGNPPDIPGILKNGQILNQNRYKAICQTYNNTRRFVTLYDIIDKIPVFSAYKYTGEQDKDRPQTPWKIEPQLENLNNDKNMENDNKKITHNNQAEDADYINTQNLDRGHLFPVPHAFDRDDKISTFTLTNVVPQASSCNRGKWRVVEKTMKDTMDNYCINNNKKTEGFVVTGAQPSTNILNNKINIPSELWTAFCCYNSNTQQWVAKAYSVLNIQSQCQIESLTLEELSKKLSSSQSEFLSFPQSQCPRNVKLALTLWERMPFATDNHTWTYVLACIVGFAVILIIALLSRR